MSVLKCEAGSTYADNGRVIRHSRRLALLDARVVLDAEILYIASTKDNVLVDLVGRADLIIGTPFATFCSKGADIFQRHSRLVRVDFVENTNVTEGGRCQQVVRFCSARGRRGTGVSKGAQKK